VSYGEVLLDKSAIDLTWRVLDFILRAFDYIVTISFGYILYCVFHWYCGCIKLFCNVWVCVCLGFVMCVFW
jgi:hypothetical protein